MNEGHVSECHLWNFTRIMEDEKWLQTLFAKPKDTRIHLMTVKNKSSWSEYYKYYTKVRFPDHVIIKCDDDIVYVDVAAFPRFIKHRLALQEHTLMFANILNNGVCAFYQQSLGLLPEHILGEFPFDPSFGKLWSNGALAQNLHQYFIEHESEWNALSNAFPVREYPVGFRFSINFFAILSKDLDIFQLVREDDEVELSYLIPLLTKRPNCVDLSFFVSHLSFYKQREEPTPINEAQLLRDYHKLAHKKGIKPFSA